MHDDSSSPESDYVKMLPLLECKLEAQDAFSTSWCNTPKGMANVKQEPVYSCDTNSRESIDQDIERETSPCISGDTSVPCDMCGFTFPSRKLMWEHHSVCQAGRIYICNICQEHFNSKTDLNNHILCHQVKPSHSCRLCGSAFSRKADLQNHLISHQTERPHKCSICGADFQRHSSLANHVKIHNYSPGRALLRPVNRDDSVYNQPSTLAELNTSSDDITMTSKGSIPSFRTLPSPAVSFQNFVTSCLNSSSLTVDSFSTKSFFAKPSGVALDNGNSVVEMSLLELFPNQEDDEYHKKIVCDEVISSKTLESASNIESPFIHSSGLESQVPLTTELQENISHETNLNNSAYLAVKQIGSQYGIKIEESLSSSQGGEQLKHTENFQSMQILTEPKNYFIENLSSSNIMPMQLSSPLSCSKCDLNYSSTVEFQSHVCLFNNHWNIMPCVEDPSQLVSVSTKLMEHNGSPELELLSNNIQNFNQSSNNDVSSTNDVAVKNKSVLKHYCLECSKKFATKQKLFRHMWIHRKKQFTCETCGTVFAERVALDNHRMALHPPSLTAPFVCNDCGKTFASRQSLWEHGRVHGNVGSGGASLLWCQECNKNFASRQGYQIHIRTHTGERPYGCRYCYKSFRDGGTLRKHERIHTGEKPHTCPLCSRAFNQKVVLREHVRWVHAASANCDPPFSCQICNVILSDREELCIHIVKHSDDMAALARAAAKKVPALDKTGLFTLESSQCVVPLEEQHIITPVEEHPVLATTTLGMDCGEIRNSIAHGNVWVDTRHGDRDLNFLSGLSTSQASTSNCENIGDNESASEIASIAQPYVYPSLINGNANHFIGILSNSMSTYVPESLDQVSIFNIQKQTGFGEGNVEHNSLNVSPRSRSLVKGSKALNMFDLKPGISFSNSIAGSLCELPGQMLPSTPSFSEQVVINV